MESNKNFLYILMVNGEKFLVSNKDDMKKILEKSCKSQFNEIWLSRNDEKALSILNNYDNAWIMYLRFNGDAGFRSSNPDYKGEEDKKLEFLLSNGQRDMYPASWIISFKKALKTLDYFLESGDKAPWITWHEE